MKSKLISSFLYSNIFCTSFFYKMSSFEMLYKDFTSMIFSYFFLVTFVAIFFFLFFTILEKIFRKKINKILEFFAIFFSLICFKAFVYSGDNPSVNYFLKKFNIDFISMFDKIIVFCSIIIVFYFFSKFLTSRNKSLFNFFKLYSAILFGLIIYFAVFNKPTIYLINNSEIKSHDHINKNIPNKRVILLILDEFDNSILLDNLNNTPNLQNLRSKSIFSDNTFSIGNSTLTMVPRILMNKDDNYKIIAKKRKRDIYLYDQNNKKTQLNYDNSIFKKIPNGKNGSSILGKYISYCLIFEGIDCEDDMNSVFKVDTMFATKIMINEIFQKLNLKKRINFFDAESFRLNSQLLKFEKYVKKFHKSFILIHLHSPHLSDNEVQESPKTILTKYKRNLSTTDQIIKKFVGYLKESPKNQQNLFIITSDHHLRMLSKESKPVPLIIKLSNDDKKIQIKRRINNLIIHEIIINYLKSDIKNHDQIKNIILNN
jgi:hypothetical protein